MVSGGRGKQDPRPPSYEVAAVLRGKNNSFPPHLDTGDFVVVVNAEKIRVRATSPPRAVSPSSGRPGGMKTETFEALQDRIPERIVEKAIKRTSSQRPRPSDVPQAQGVQGQRAPPCRPEATAPSAHLLCNRQMSSNSVVYWGTDAQDLSCPSRLVPGTGTITINGRPGDNYLNYNPAYMLGESSSRDPWSWIGVRHPGECPRRRTHRPVGSDQARCRPCSVSCPPTTASLSRQKATSPRPRAKERRKYGLKKARKAPQFSKR